MTASASVHASTAIADPNNPNNVLVPAFSNTASVTPSAVTTYSPVLLGLVPASNGNVNLMLENATLPVVVKATAGTPITGFRILQVRSTNTTVTNIVGLK